MQENGAIGWKLLQSMAKKLRDAQQDQNPLLAPEPGQTRAQPT